jgi:hypothetical protein
MKHLTKFVVVNDRGADWLDMTDGYAEAAEMSARAPGTHVERWVYREGEEGHEIVAKLRCN